METQASVFGRRISNALFLTLAVYIFSCFMSPISGQAHPIVQGWENHAGPRSGLTLEPRFSFLSTSKNYDKDATSVAIASNGSLSQLYFDTLGSFGFTEDLFVYARFSLLSTSVTSSLFVGGSGSAFGLSDQFAGLAYRAWKSDSGHQLVFQVEGIFPAYSNSNSKVQGNPYLGDGSIDVTAGAFADFALPIANENEYFISTGLGFTKRSYGYSSALPWNLHFKRDPRQGFWFLVGARGQTSLQTDVASDNATILAQVTADQIRGGGGSYAINAVNPTWYLAELAAGYKSDSGILVYAKGGTTLYGKNAPAALFGTLGLQWAFGAENASAENYHPVKEAPRKENPTPTVVRTGGFTSYDLETKVVSTNDQLYLVRIQKGTHDGIAQGQIFDIFRTEQDDVTGRVVEKRIARAKATHVKSEETVLTVLEYFIESWIDVGDTVKRLLK